MTKASICRLSKEIQEIASSTYFGRPLSQLYKQHFESVMPINVSLMFKQTCPRKGNVTRITARNSVHKNVLSSGVD